MNTFPGAPAPTASTPPAAARAVLVLGARGRFGRHAVEAFAAAGWQVRAQCRGGAAGAGAAWPAGVTEVRADALDVAALAPAAAGARVIVNALNPDYTRWATLLPPITAATIALARASGARLLLPGNVYNFGAQLPARLDEDTPFDGRTARAAQRIAAEAALRDAAAAGVRSAVIRAGDFLGGTGTWLDLGIGRRLARGVVTDMGPGDLAHAWAWLPDLAQAFVQVAEREAALPAHETMHFAGHDFSGDQLFAALEAHLGRPLRRAAFPWWALRLASPVAAMPRALLQMRYLWQRPHRLAGQRLAALVGPLPATPLPLLLRRALADLPGLAPAAAARLAT